MTPRIGETLLMAVLMAPSLGLAGVALEEEVAQVDVQEDTQEELSPDWAMTRIKLGNTLRSRGTRTDRGQGLRLLAEAVAAYRDALRVYTREQLPQDWARTQNNLGNALRDQGTRTGGDEGRRLLVEAKKVLQGALSVYQAAGAGHYVGLVKRNISRTEVFLSGDNNPKVQFIRGVFYARGEGVAQDDTKAAIWLSKAAEQGHGRAQFLLGALVLSGRGMAKDRVSGYAWVHLSAENGIEKAVWLRDKLRKEMESSQLAQAEKLAGERRRAQQSSK